MRSLQIIILAILLSFLPRQYSRVLTKEISKIPTPTVVVSVTPAITGNPQRVIKVVDGDTIKVDINGQSQTIRLIGVDTPEVVDPRKPVQCFGKEASAFTKKLLENQSVILQPDPTQGDKDKYQRLLRYVYLLDGTLVNQKIISQGYGHEYTYRIPYQFQSQFKESQKLAEASSLGLWSPDVCK